MEKLFKHGYSGYANHKCKCDICITAAKEYRAKTKAHRDEFSRIYNIEHQKEISERKRRYYKENREREIFRNKKWKEDNKEKFLAYRNRPEVKIRAAELAKEYRLDPVNIVKNHARKEIRKRIISGELIKGSCEICGAKNTQAHHFDYSRPLDISWLCTEHHTMVHKKGLIAFWEVE